MRLEPQFKPLVSRGFGVTWNAHVMIEGDRVDKLPVTGGDITDENDADIRRRCNLTVPGLHEYIPSNKHDYLWPIGRIEVALTADMSFRGGRVVQENTPLGVYRVQKPKITLAEGGDRAITFEGYDRSLSVGRAKLRRGMTISPTDDLRELVQDIVEERLPVGVQFDFPEDDEEINVGQIVQWDLGDNPWIRLREVLLGLGYDLFFSAVGICVVRETTDPLDRAPDFVHTTGDTAEIMFSSRDRATVKGAEWSLDDENTFNHIVVKAEATDNNTEIYGEAWDADPLSPTYIGADDLTDPNFGQSPFGDKVNVITSQTAPNTKVANIAARAHLIRSLGLQEDLQVRTFWLPHEANDIVEFHIPEAEVSNTYVMDGIKQTLQLEGNLDMATRQRRVRSSIV